MVWRWGQLQINERGAENGVNNNEKGAKMGTEINAKSIRNRAGDAHVFLERVGGGGHGGQTPHPLRDLGSSLGIFLGEI